MKKLTPELRSQVRSECTQMRKDLLKRLPRTNATKKAKFVLGPEYVGCINSGNRAYISCQPAASWQRALGEKQLFAVYASEYDKNYNRNKVVYIGYDKKKAIAAWMRCARKAVEFNVAARAEIMESRRVLSTTSDPNDWMSALLNLGDHGVVA